MLLVCYALYQILPEYVAKKATIMNFLQARGHLGRHFENNSFSDVGFWGNFRMLFMISNTTQIR